MSGFVTWLPDVLRDSGVDVYVMPGAETRSTWKSGFTLKAIVWHHTATGQNWQDGHVAALLRDGRRDLDGPLSQVGVERDGTWVIVACGRANHNGYGRFGNDALGLEFYNSGVGEPWPQAQVEAGVVGTRAVRDFLGWDVPVLGHKESDPGRKVDPFGLDMSEIRHRLVVPTGVVEDEEDMLLVREGDKGYWLLSGGKMSPLAAVADLQALRGLGVKELRPTTNTFNAWRRDFT